MLDLITQVFGDDSLPAEALFAFRFKTERLAFHSHIDIRHFRDAHCSISALATKVGSIRDSVASSEWHRQLQKMSFRLAIWSISAFVCGFTYLEIGPTDADTIRGAEYSTLQGAGDGMRRERQRNDMWA